LMWKSVPAQREHRENQKLDSHPCLR
jgi:hypothetical protein